MFFHFNAYEDYESDHVPVYRSAIVDECGAVVCYCENLSDGQIDDYLDQHPECKLRYV